MPQTGTVIPQGLNLRATPGGTVIKVLPQGASVEILEDLGDFLKVSAAGQVGFVAAKLFQTLSIWRIHPEHPHWRHAGKTRNGKRQFSFRR